MTRITDLAYEIEGENIQLEQDAGCGEVDRIALHPVHVQLLATELGMLRGDQDAWRRVGALERRLRILRDRIEVLDDMLWLTPTYPPGSNSADPQCIYSDATLTLAEEWCADLPADVTQDQSVSPQVTPSHAAERGRTHANAGAEETEPKPVGKHGRTGGFPSAQAGLPLEAGQ